MAKYELLEESPVVKSESIPQYALRTGARTAARVGEEIAGLPGTLEAITKPFQLVDPFQNPADRGPVLGPDPSQWPSASELVQQIKKPQQMLPTPKDIRESAKSVTGEYLEPKTSGEEFYDQIIGDATALFLPTPGSKIGPLKGVASALGKAVGKSAVANTAKWAAETVTGSPAVGEATKLGTMVLGGTAGGRTQIKEMKNKSYKDAFSNLPAEAKFDISPEKSKLDTLIATIKKGDKPDKNFLLERLEASKNIFPKKKDSGKVDVQSLVNLKQDWNSHLEKGGLSKNAHDILKKGVGILNEGIGRYGQTNAKFFDPYKIGEELTGALKSTNYIQRFINKHPTLQNSIKNPLLRTALFAGAGYVASPLTTQKVLGAAAVGGAALGARELAKFYQLLTKSPIAREAYKGFVDASLKGALGPAIRSAKRLNDEADKFSAGEESSRYELLED